MAKGPQPIGDILAQLMARRGFAQVAGAAALEAAWREAAGQLAAEHSHAIAIRRGKLEVLVAHSAMVQELSFQKAAIVQRLGGLLPDGHITDLRFRVGPIH